MSAMSKAIDELKTQDPPLYRATARKYAVDHTTLMRNFKGETLPKQEYHETRQLLSHAQERVLLNRINTLCDRGIPPTNTIVKAIALKICGKQPGKNWAYEFIQRHSDEIASVMLEGFDLSRQKADNYTGIKQYFDLVCCLIL